MSRACDDSEETLTAQIRRLREELKAAEVQLRAWQSQFGTTQLTHAIARLEAAEQRAEEAEDKRRIDEEQWSEIEQRANDYKREALAWRAWYDGGVTADAHTKIILRAANEQKYGKAAAPGHRSSQ